MQKQDEKKRSLLSCYKLSDYPVEDYCVQVWQAGSNSQYREALAATPVVGPILTYFSENPSGQNLSEIN